MNGCKLLVPLSKKKLSRPNSSVNSRIGITLYEFRYIICTIVHLWNHAVCILTSFSIDSANIIDSRLGINLWVSKPVLAVKDTLKTSLTKPCEMCLSSLRTPVQCQVKAKRIIEYRVCAIRPTYQLMDLYCRVLINLTYFISVFLV